MKLSLRNISLMACSVVYLCSCTQLTLDWAKLSPRDEAARPDLTGDAARISADLGAWPEIHARYASVLQAEVYGRLPDSGSIEVVSSNILDTRAFEGRAVLEEYVLRVRPVFDDVAASSAEFRLELLTPMARPSAPLIIVQTFCTRASSVPHPSVAGRNGESGEMDGPIGSFAKMVFGRYICTPPIESILDQGYALVVIQPAEFVPDSAEEGLAALAALSEGHTDDATRWGAIAAWAWQVTKIVDLFESDKRIQQDKIVVWGHSRFAKSALLATAIDPRIDGAIAHQSGTGGASLNRKKPGESVASITKNYPHWFSESYASFKDDTAAMESDQHMLLAALAPRPVFLGNARRDVWSDPNGAFRAAAGADVIYESLNSAGLEQDRLDIFDPYADITYWIRPGTHGVVKEDWEAFFRFLNAHFPDD